MPHSGRLALGLGAAAAASLLAVAQAQQPFPAGTPGRPAGALIELTPEADTWFEVNEPPTGAPVNPSPQGGSQMLQAGWSDVGINEYALMRFALPADLPAEQVVRAELVLHVTAASILTYFPPEPVSGTLSLLFGHVLDAWDESTLSSLDPPGTAVGRVQADKEWRPCHGEDCGDALADVTPLVRDWLGGAQNNGLALHAGGRLGDQPVMGTVFVVASRESAHPPVLRIKLVDTDDETPTPRTPTLRPPTATTAPTSRTSPALWLPLALRGERSSRPVEATRSPTPSATSTPDPTETSTPSPTPETGRYLLLELWADKEYGSGCPPMAIDFPTYWFNASTGVLRVWGALGNPRLEPGDVGYYASGQEATGTVIGTASGLQRIERLPFEADRVAIQSVDGAGGVALTYAGEALNLAAGGQRQWQTVENWRDPGCVVTTTLRLTDFGYQDRAKIEYY